jgi:hypothetical protein
MKYQSTNEIEGLVALHDHIIVKDMSFSGRKLSSGILLLGDDLKTDGIRPRWAEVYCVGPDQQDIQPGQWILVEHGRWTRGSKVKINGEEMIIRRVDPSCVIFISNEQPNDDNISTAIDAQKLQRE